MNETSLMAQIKAIADLRQYIELCQIEAADMLDEVTEWIKYLRSEGLPKEVAEKFEGELYMGQVKHDLETMLERMRNHDCRYLDNEMNNLNNALNR